jgi:hypothetical protein
MKLTEAGFVFVNYIYLAKDIILWLAVLNKVMNH